MRYAFILIFGLIVFGCKKDKTPPLPVPPASLTATAVSTSQINLSWTDNSTNETGFKVERRTGSGSYAEVASLSQNTNSYSDAGLTKNTTYTYRVSAFNTGGPSTTYTNEASATTFDDVPATATNLTATGVSTSQINLAWEDKATNETGYKVERKIVNGSFSVVATIGANSTSYSDNGLTENTIYTYRVFPYNTFGNGAYSNEASDTTLPDITSGLIAYYPFSGNAADSSGNNLNGTVNGASLTKDRYGIDNKAYSFNGTTNNIIVQHNSLLNLTNFTISSWVKIPNYSNLYYEVLTKGVDLDENYENIIYGNPAGGVECAIKWADGSRTHTPAITSPNNVPQNQWAHIASTYEVATGIINTYINGLLYSSINVSANKTPKFNNSPLYIGFDPNDQRRFYTGMIDDIRIYNRPLTKAQITYLATH